MCFSCRCSRFVGCTAKSENECQTTKYVHAQFSNVVSSPHASGFAGQCSRPTACRHPAWPPSPFSPCPAQDASDSVFSFSTRGSSARSSVWLTFLISWSPFVSRSFSCSKAFCFYAMGAMSSVPSQNTSHPCVWSFSSSPCTAFPGALVFMPWFDWLSCFQGGSDPQMSVVFVHHSHSR